MPPPFTFEALNRETGETLTDPDKLAASRGLTVLFICARFMKEIARVGSSENALVIIKTLLTALTVAQSGQQLEADARCIAKQLGCEIVVDDPSAVNGRPVQ